MALGAFSPLPIRLGGKVDTGWTPEQHARLCADLVAAKQSSPLCWLTLTVGASTATVDAYRGQNGDGLTFAPTIVRLGTGSVTLTFTGNIFIDAYGISEPISIIGGAGNTWATGSVSVQSANGGNSVACKLYDITGVLANNTASLVIW